LREAFEEEIERELERERTKFEKESEKHLLQVGIVCSSHLFNGSFSFNFIGFLGPCLFILQPRQCSWLAFFYGIIEATLGNLMFLVVR